MFQNLHFYQKLRYGFVTFVGEHETNQILEKHTDITYRNSKLDILRAYRKPPKRYGRTNDINNYNNNQQLNGEQEDTNLNHILQIQTNIESKKN